MILSISSGVRAESSQFSLFNCFARFAAFAVRIGILLVGVNLVGDGHASSLLIEQKIVVFFLN